MRISRVMVFLLSSLSCSFVGPISASNNWPLVKTVSAVYHLDKLDSDVRTTNDGFDFSIPDSAGKSVYVLQCHTGLYEDADFNYSGLLHCRLKALYGLEIVSTLLTETMDQTSDWENRGRFLVKHLLPSCAKYPDWGSARTFQLRGMVLSIEIADVEFGASKNQQTVKSMTVKVTVVRSTTVTSSIAKKAGCVSRIGFITHRVDVRALGKGGGA